jgi:hypothetical protein
MKVENKNVNPSPCSLKKFTRLLGEGLFQIGAKYLNSSENKQTLKLQSCTTGKIV